MDEVYGSYLTNPARKLLGVVAEERLRGVIGIEDTESGSAIVCHIAVAPDRRLQGLGRSMLEGLCTQLGLTVLIAETDSDAVDFYRHCGFEVERLDARLNSMERFRCTLRKAGRVSDLDRA